MPITINDVRFSYCNLFQPVTRPGQTEAKYGVTILVPKTNAAAKAAIDAAIAEAIEAGVNKCWNGIRPPVPALCIHDGDGVRPSDGQPYGEECKGCWVFTASSKQAPFVVDAQVQNIIDPRLVYSGMWGNVNVSFFPYNSNGKKGIGCGLNGIQKTRDGEPLSGRVTANEAFKPVPTAPAVPSYDAAATTAPVTTAYAAMPTAGYPAAAPAYPQSAVDPITGQPYVPSGTPVMGI